MRKQVHRLCVEILQDSQRNVDIFGEPPRYFAWISMELSRKGWYWQCEKPALTTARAGVPS